jgi:hypothetical protein
MVVLSTTSSGSGSHVQTVKGHDCFSKCVNAFVVAITKNLVLEHRRVIFQLCSILAHVNILNELSHFFGFTVVHQSLKIILLYYLSVSYYSS